MERGNPPRFTTGAEPWTQDKTRSGYIRVVQQFTGFLGRSPDTATVEDLRRYQLHLVDHGTSPVSLNAAITGLKFFFEVTLDQGACAPGGGWPGPRARCSTVGGCSPV